MKKLMGLIMACILMLSIATMAMAVDKGALADGDNKIELPWNQDEASVYTYTATQTGTLYIAAVGFEYADGNFRYSDSTDTMAEEWSMYTSLTVNGTELSGGYFGSVEVVEGQTYTFAWLHLYAAESWYECGWRATINLSYSSDLVPQQGSESLPVELWKEQCPTNSIEIPAGGTVYYTLADFWGAHFTVKGEEAYVIATTRNADLITQEVTYQAVNGVVTVPVGHGYMDIQIGNKSTKPATFALDYYYPLGTENNPDQLVIGENVANTVEDDFEGYIYQWTAECNGNLVLTLPETGWTYEITNIATGQDVFHTYGDPAAENPVKFPVSKGDKLRIVINSFDIMDYSVPGGEVVFAAAAEYSHVYGDWTVNPDGSETSICTLCGYKGTKCKHESTTLTGAKDPDCTNDGYTGDEVCNACGEVVKGGSAIPATGHHYEAGETVPGTCSTKAYTTYTCANCGDEYQQQGEYDPNNHELLSLVEGERKATCTEEGFMATWQCEDCEELFADAAGTMPTTYENQVIPKLPHNPGQWQTIREPSETEDGLKRRFCTECDALVEEAVIPSAGHEHSYTAEDPVPGTCSSRGYTKYVCACGKSYQVDGEFDPNNHANLTQVQSAKEATCAAEGCKATWQCGDCQAYFADETAITPTTLEAQSIPKLTHNAGDWETTKEPTQEEMGLKQKKCKECGEVLEEEEIPILPKEEPTQPSQPAQPTQPNQPTQPTQKPTEPSEAPGNGGGVIVAIVIAVAAIAVGAFMFLKKRKA